MPIRNTDIDIVKLSEYRDKLFKEMNDAQLPTNEKYSKELWDCIFATGMFAGVNIVANNPEWQKKEKIQLDLGMIEYILEEYLMEIDSCSTTEPYSKTQIKSELKKIQMLRGK